ARGSADWRRRVPRSGPSLSACLAERQVDPIGQKTRVVGARLQRQHAVVAQTGGAAEDDDVAVAERHAGGALRSLLATDQEYGRQAEGHRDDRRRVVLLVPVLVQAQAAARRIAVDEAGIGQEAGKARDARRGGG